MFQVMIKKLVVSDSNGLMVSALNLAARDQSLKPDLVSCVTSESWARRLVYSYSATLHRGVLGLVNSWGNLTK